MANNNEKVTTNPLLTSARTDKFYCGQENKGTSSKTIIINKNIYRANINWQVEVRKIIWGLIYI
jgi:hypothetical protein